MSSAVPFAIQPPHAGHPRVEQVQPKGAPALPCAPRLPAVSKSTTARLAALVEIHLKGPIHRASLRQCSLYPPFWMEGGTHALQPLAVST